jgi:hypothetical protein
MGECSGATTWLLRWDSPQDVAAMVATFATDRLEHYKCQKYLFGKAAIPETIGPLAVTTGTMEFPQEPRR